MTLSDIAELLGKSENTIQKSFNRTRDTLSKKGIIITKEGRGKDTDYTVTFPDGTKME